MTTEDQETLFPAGAAAADLQPGDAGAGAGTACADAAAARCRAGWLRQLLRNLYGGLRISLSLRVHEDFFAATPAALTVLALTDLLLNLLASFLLVGRTGSFAAAALPGFYFHLPLFLLFALLAGRLLSWPSFSLAIPVALVAASIPVELSHAAIEGAAQLAPLRWLQDYLAAPHYYRFFWWWSATSLLFLLRLRAPSASRRVWLLVVFLALVVPPLWYFPRADLWVSADNGAESGEVRLTEEVLDAQPLLLESQLAALLPGRRGESHLYFVGFAGDASQDVFLKELTSARRLFDERFGTSGRSIMLANNPRSATTLPFATAGNLERALARVGEVMGPDDVLFLYLTSHGSKEYELAVNNRPLELDGITPEDLSEMLKRSGIRWKVVVVSACYSGGFIKPLQDDRTMVITAADATHESFGCGNGENFTWFGEAYLNEALRETTSFTEAFQRARATIARWEEDELETPSNPQIWVGREIGEKLKSRNGM